jgi:hypothetical protein
MFVRAYLAEHRAPFELRNIIAIQPVFRKIRFLGDSLCIVGFWDLRDLRDLRDSLRLSYEERLRVYPTGPGST